MADPTPPAVETPPAETAEARLDRLERENGELKARNETYDKTLKALAEREPPPPVHQPPGQNDDQFRGHLRSKGYSDEEITKNLGILRDFIPHPEIGGAFAQGLGTVADAADYASWRASDRGFRDITDDEALAFDAEVRKARQECVRRGEFRSYSDCAAMVKSKKAPSGRDVEAEIERRVNERIRTGAAAGITQRGASTSTQHAGPGPAGGVVSGSGRSLTRDEFQALPIEKKREYLEQVQAQF